MPNKINPAIKERAMRMVADHRGTIRRTRRWLRRWRSKVGVGRETVRRWVVQADIDAGARPGATSDEQAEINA